MEKSCGKCAPKASPRPPINFGNLCKPVHDITNHSTSICPFLSGKCGTGNKLQKFEYFENEKSFFNEIKNTFHSSGGAIIWWKNTNLIKNSGHKL